MAIIVYMDVIDPQLNLKKEVAKDHDCRILEIVVGNGNTLQLHFSDYAAVQAFAGLCNMTVTDTGE